MVTKYQAERSYEQAIAIAIRRRNPGLPPTVAADRAKALATRRAVRFVPMRGLVVDDLAAVQAIAPELSTAPRPLAEEWERREAMGAALNGAGTSPRVYPGHEPWQDIDGAEPTTAAEYIDRAARRGDL